MNIPNIFKAYDIRGLVGSQLTKQFGRTATPASARLRSLVPAPPRSWASGCCATARTAPRTPRARWPTSPRCRAGRNRRSSPAGRRRRR